MIDFNVINQPVTILGLNPGVVSVTLITIIIFSLVVGYLLHVRESRVNNIATVVSYTPAVVGVLAVVGLIVALLAYDSSPQRIASSREHDRGIDLVADAIYDTYGVDNVDTKALRYPISSGKTTLEHIIVESDPAELPMIEVEIDGQWYEYPVSFDNDAGEVTLYPDTRSVNNYPVPAEFKIEN